MFPFTPHTTLRLDYRSGGSSFKETTSPKQAIQNSQRKNFESLLSKLPIPRLELRNGQLTSAYASELEMTNS